MFLDEAHLSFTDGLHSISESDVTESSVVIKWNHMEHNPPSILHHIIFCVDFVVDSLTSEGDRFAIGGVVGGLAVFALICVIVIAVGIILWYMSVYNRTVEFRNTPVNS